MAEEVVVKEQLTTSMIAAGEELTRRLRGHAEFHLLCSLWLYEADANQWKMALGTPLVETRGPIEAFHIVEDLIAGDWPQSESPLYTLSLLRSSHPLVIGLRSLGHFEIPEGVAALPRQSFSGAGKRISLRIFRDAFVEDALIYYIE